LIAIATFRAQKRRALYVMVARHGKGLTIQIALYAQRA
jgi:hypothetical protein